MILPTEIWEQVLSYLDQNSLAQCSTVSSKFSYITAPLLYHCPVLPTAARFRLFAKELSAQNAMRVQVLDLTNTARRWDSIRRTELTDLLTRCLSVNHLDLDMCTPLRDSDIDKIMEKIGKNLHYLSLCSCTYLSGESIQSVAKYCRGLNVFNISGICTFDRPVIEVAEKNPHLQCVNLAWCAHITEEAIRAFTKYCPQLKYLDMEGCHNVLGINSDSDGDLPQPEWETEDDDDDDDADDSESVDLEQYPLEPRIGIVFGTPYGDNIGSYTDEYDSEELVMLQMEMDRQQHELYDYDSDEGDSDEDDSYEDDSDIDDSDVSDSDLGSQAHNTTA